MIYLIYLFLSCLYLATLGQYRQCRYWKLVGYSLPVILFWCLIIGCQYGIGTDYFSYIDIFSGNNLEYISGIRGEYVFTAIAESVLFLGLPPQSGFILISLVEVLMLFYVMHESISSKYTYLFFFVFISFSGTFHNQMNGLRQYLAIYIVSVIVCLLCEKKFAGSLLLSVIAFFCHKSSAIILPVIYLIYLLRGRDTRKFLTLILLGGVVSSMVLSNQVISLIVPYFDTYAHYLSSARVESYGLIQKLTKYIYIIPILWAIYLYPKMKMSEMHRWLFVFGIYGFALKLSVMSLTIVSRMGLYLEIISCVPLAYLLVYLYESSRIKSYALMLLYLLAPYAFKILYMRTGEYGFDTIFLH